MAFFHMGDAPTSRGFWGSPIAASCGGRLFPQPASVTTWTLAAHECRCPSCLNARVTQCRQRHSTRVFLTKDFMSRMASA